MQALDRERGCGYRQDPLLATAIDTLLDVQAPPCELRASAFLFRLMVSEAADPTVTSCALCALLANSAEARASGHVFRSGVGGVRTFLLGRGGFNTVHLVRIRGKEKPLVFKANDAGTENPDLLAQPNQREAVHRAANAVANLLGYKVFVKTRSASLDGKPGMAMKYGGDSLLKVSHEDINFWQSGKTRKQLTLCQIFDFIIGESDVHCGNFVRALDGKIRRIDVDRSFPPCTLPREYLFKYEEGNAAMRTYGCCMPVVIDEEMKQMIEGITEETFRKEIWEAGLGERQIDATIQRITVLKSKITDGSIKVISNEEWSDSELLIRSGVTPNNSYFQYLLLQHIFFEARHMATDETAQIKSLRWYDALPKLAMDVWVRAGKLNDIVSNLPIPIGLPPDGEFVDAYGRIFVDGWRARPIKSIFRPKQGSLCKDGKPYRAGDMIIFRGKYFYVTATNELLPYRRRRTPKFLHLIGVDGEIYVRGRHPGQANVAISGERGIFEGDLPTNGNAEKGKIYKCEDGTLRMIGDGPGNLRWNDGSAKYEIVPGGDLPNGYEDLRMGTPYRCQDNVLRTIGRQPGCVIWHFKKRKWVICGENNDTFFEIPKLK
jgi:hypothetical protein